MNITNRRNFMNKEDNLKRLWLYNNGNECIKTTGGWSTDRGFFNGGDYSIEKNTNSIELKASYFYGSCGGCTVATQKPINLTGYTKLYFDGIFYIGDTDSPVGDVAILQVDDIIANSSVWDGAFLNRKLIYFRKSDDSSKQNINGVIGFDIKDMSVPNYICLQVHAYPGQVNVPQRMLMRRLWLE